MRTLEKKLHITVEIASVEILRDLGLGILDAWNSRQLCSYLPSPSMDAGDGPAQPYLQN